MELAKRFTGQTLYILDEPNTELHFEDVRKLPEACPGGINGGEVAAEGMPGQLPKAEGSFYGCLSGSDAGEVSLKIWPQSLL